MSKYGRSRSTVNASSGEHVRRRLAALNPVDELALASAELDLALDGMGETIVAARRRQHRSPVRRVTIGIALAVVALIATAVAAGGIITTHTGIFPSFGGTEGDTSELLRTDAPGFPALVARLTQNIAFPPGYDKQAYLARYVDEPSHKLSRDGVYDTVQAAGIENTITFWSVCAWRGDWLTAHTERNATLQATAVAGLQNVVDSSDVIKKWDSFWPHYLELAANEKAGSAALPTALAPGFDTVSCGDLERLGAAR